MTACGILEALWANKNWEPFIMEALGNVAPPSDELVAPEQINHDYTGTLIQSEIVSREWNTKLSLLTGKECKNCGCYLNPFEWRPQLFKEVALFTIEAPGSERLEKVLPRMCWRVPCSSEKLKLFPQTTPDLCLNASFLQDWLRDSC